jgi:sec-independent protein translocase protein TatB
MFGINLTEFFVIGVLALILIGPKQLPHVARNIGRFMNELKRGADIFAQEIKHSVDEDLRVQAEREDQIKRQEIHDQQMAKHQETAAVTDDKKDEKNV